MTESIHYQRWCEANFRAINRFYKSQKHKGKANGSDIVYYAYTQEPDKQTILGAVRLVPYTQESKATNNHSVLTDPPDFMWLRSMYIDETLRGNKLGSQLLDRINDEIELPIYCFPYDHLERFYGQCGYRLLTPDTLPEPLRDLFERYEKNGEKIITMGLNC